MKTTKRKTRLVEFTDQRGNTLRGILTGDRRARRGVLMLPGYERAASTEPKFKRLADKLAQSEVTSLRLDYSGCGLSDGNFAENTVASYADEASRALQFLRQGGVGQLCIVAHSLSACIVASLSPVEQDELKRIVLIAPALNQRALQRYWFVRNTMRKKDPLFRTTWQNYQTHLSEQAFLDDCAQPYKMTGKNFVGTAFFPENKERDYQEGMLPLLSKTLLVHGEKDDIVPRESLSIRFPNCCFVGQGDHDLERPDMMNMWLSRAVDFLTQ